MKFDKGRPIPKPQAARSRYHFDKMDVGESFFVEGATCEKFTAYAAFARRHPGWKFVSRTVTEKGKRGVRCWCVERPRTLLTATPSRIHLAA